MMLSRALVRIAATRSIAEATALAYSQIERNNYILRVLQAPISVRNVVRQVAGANVTVDSSNIGQTHLVCILTAFELMPPEQKAAFIEAFRATTSLAGQGLLVTSGHTVYDPIHVPPQNVP